MESPRGPSQPRQPEYDDYRRRFDFAEGFYPTQGSLRHFEKMLGPIGGNDLIAQTVELADAVGCISEEATQYGILGLDVMMIHDAACACVAVRRTMLATSQLPECVGLRKK